jgi:hypothetical protein
MKKVISLRIGLVVGIFATLLALAPMSAVAASISIDLCATTGSVSVPGGSIPIWGYALGDCSGSPAAQLPGPELVVVEGDSVTVHLHNNLAESTAIWFQGQGTAPDLTGAAAGGTHDYTFTASKPGTYLYEAGPLSNAGHQVAMGMYGALIVNPTTANQAYDDTGSAFGGQATVVLGEIDPALNNSASPVSFDMRNYAPKYYLINGKPYDPANATIPVAAGTTELLRFVNAGLQPHSMTALGLHQQVLAIDGNRYAIGGTTPYSQNVVAQTLQPGQTSDVLAAIPATPNLRYAVYDANLLLNNNINAANFGGMLTFLDAGATAGSGKPTTSNTALAPNPTKGSVDVAVTAKVTTATALDPTKPAEYFIDTKGVDGSGGTMVTTPCPTGADVCGTIPSSVLTPLLAGNHTVYVHAQNGAGWGAFDFAVLNLDKAGPATSGLVLSPNPTNGLVAVALSATGDDTATGGSNIAAAEYFIDSAGTDGTGISMTVPLTGAKVAALKATIAAGLTEGIRTIFVHAKDSLDNWGPLAQIDLKVDKTGPTTGQVTATPNPSNGKIGVNANTAAVRVVAYVSDPVTVGVNSIIAAAEGFIDTVNTNGTGIVFVPQDGNFNTSTEWATVDIPLTTINALSEANHTIYVHGKDAAGNWGSTGTVLLRVDKTAPTFTTITLAPNPTNGAATVVLTVNGAADTGGAGVSGGEYWINPPTTTTPAPGSGTQFSGLTANIPVGTLSPGAHTVSARIRDAAGNWSTTTSSATLTVVPDAIFSNGFETGANPWGWSSASTNSTTRLNVTTTAPLVGTRSLQAQGSNTNYVQFNFGTTANPATPTYDARFYFRPNGNTSTGKDILSAATSSTFGTIDFRVRYRLNGTTPQVQIVLGAAGTSATWTNVLGGTSNNYIEVVWQSGTSLQLYVNGALSQTLTPGAGSVGAVRLGSVTNTGNATVMYFDAFTSKRTVSPLIGTGP